MVELLAIGDTMRVALCYCRVQYCHCNFRSRSRTSIDELGTLKFYLHVPDLEIGYNDLAKMRRYQASDLKKCHHATWLIEVCQCHCLDSRYGPKTPSAAPRCLRNQTYYIQNSLDSYLHTNMQRVFMLKKYYWKYSMRFQEVLWNSKSIAFCLTW